MLVLRLDLHLNNVKTNDMVLGILNYTFFKIYCSIATKNFNIPSFKSIF